MHVQVVDPSQEGANTVALSEEALEKAAAEIAQKKDDLAAKEETDPNDDPNEMADAPAGPSSEANDNNAIPLAAAPAAEEAVDAQSDDGSEVMVSEAMAVEAEAEANALLVAGTPVDVSDDKTYKSATPTDAGAGPVAEGGAPTLTSVEAELNAMGFVEPSLVAVVLEKHGADVAACARDLAASTEWEKLLDDLAEMGFENRTLNKTLMLKHDGNVKRTVRELVEDTA